MADGGAGNTQASKLPEVRRNCWITYTGQGLDYIVN